MQEARPERRLLTVVCGDLAGYTRLMRDDEEGTHAALQGHLEELVTPSIRHHGGRLVKTTGDGWLVTFDSPVEAARCASEIQLGMDRRNVDEPDERRQRFRIGMHLGDVIVTPTDVFGDAVNVAARLQTLAQPGQICLSAAVHDQVRHALNQQARDLGERRLKNLKRPVRVFALGGDAPLRARRLVVLLVAVLGIVAVGVASALWMRSSGTTSTPQRRPAVAVLPFANQSGDAAQDFFSDGITEDVIAALGRFHGLVVMAASAVRPYKGTNLRPSELGRELGVRYLVEGSVRRSGERVRVAAQLTDTNAGRLLWSEQYDDETQDVFAMQQKLAQKVAGTLAVNLGRIEQQRLIAKAPSSLDAYELVLRARESLTRATREDNRAARVLLERAIEIDPGYATAHALLGLAVQSQAIYGWTEFASEGLERAEQLGRRALALDPDNADAHRQLSRLYSASGRYDRALAAADSALAINPSDAESLANRGSALVWLGRFPEAIAQTEAALQLNPNQPPAVLLDLGLAYFQAGRHGDATALMQRQVIRHPQLAVLHAVLAASYAELGRMPEAAQEREAVMRINPYFQAKEFGNRFQDPVHHALLVAALAKAGLR